MAKSPPPVEYRFKKGHKSKGRPKGSRNKRTKMRTPALDERTNYPVGKGMRRMTRREAIIRYARDRALTLNDPQLTSLLVEAERKAKLAESLSTIGRSSRCSCWVMGQAVRRWKRRLNGLVWAR